MDLAQIVEHQPKIDKKRDAKERSRCVSIDETGG